MTKQKNTIPHLALVNECVSCTIPRQTSVSYQRVYIDSKRRKKDINYESDSKINSSSDNVKKQYSKEAIMLEQRKR